MLRFVHLLILLCAAYLSPAQVYIATIGNLADANETFFDHLDQYLNQQVGQQLLLINGDVIAGCDDAGVVAQSADKVSQLIRVIEKHPTVTAYVLPGDRDWDNSGVNGWDCSRELEDLIEDAKLPNLHWPLDKGCPGPEIIEPTPYVRLVLLNTQWWNHPHRKPSQEDVVCDYADPEVVLEELYDGVAEAQNQNVVIAGHFPPKSQGPSGGEFSFAEHVWPPIIGGLRVAYRHSVGASTDLENPRFAHFASELRALASENRGLFFVGGQEQHQQLIAFRRNFVLNSGGTSNKQWVAKHAPALFSDLRPGFGELVFADNGSVTYRFHPIQAAIESVALYGPPCLGVDSIAGLPTNPNYRPCLREVVPTEKVVPILPSSTEVIAGAQYGASRFKQLFFGEHYRPAWQQPVSLPYLLLEDGLGGLYPIQRGGGRQTTSLKLEKTNGERFVFRSVDKDPSGALSLDLRNTIIEDVTRDQTSTQHPYGALVAASLLDKVDILHATPKLYVLAPTPRLGPFRQEYAYMLGMLEERPAGSKRDRPGTFGTDEVYKSFEFFQKRYANQDLEINYNEFVRARLFDILIGDWSKHEDNWKWAGFAQENGLERIRPIPRDRDHAFSQMDGLFPWLASRRWAVPNLEHFDYKIQDIRSLTFQARHMDKLLLSSLSREDFLREARYLQSKLTDEHITTAVETLPQSIAQGSGQVIAQKLQQRRSDLLDYADQYYQLHAAYVDVVGTDKEDLFSVNYLADGAIEISVEDPKGSTAGRQLYNRRFVPAETKEIRLYGLGDDDRFVLRGAGPKSSKVRIIGGPGTDAVVDSSANSGATRTWVYEKSMRAEMTLGSTSKRVRTWRDELYYYDRRAYEYNSYFPLAYLTFNSFNGLQLGGGVTYKRRSFMRRDYSSKHNINGAIGTLGNFELNYKATWREVIRKWDLIAEGQLERPAFYNFFFGRGNNSIKDDVAFDNDFYLIRLQHWRLAASWQRPFWQQSTFEIGLGYDDYATTDTENTVLGTPELVYGEQALNFGFIRPKLVLDLRDHQVFPSRGFRLEAAHDQGFGSDVDFGVTKLAAEMHVSTRRFPITLSGKIGYSFSQGEVPFYRLPGLGLNDGLRGYQRRRFVGDDAMYYNIEFRCPVGQIRNIFLPFVIGIRTFYDRGVIMDDVDSDGQDWKEAYGGGLYIIPLSRSYTISALLGFSEEESGIMQLQLGTNF